VEKPDLTDRTDTSVARHPATKLLQILVILLLRRQKTGDKIVNTGNKMTRELSRSCYLNNKQSCFLLVKYRS